jgi:sodium/potassium-transporting ATPase subunit alpha
MDQVENPPDLIVDTSADIDIKEHQLTLEELQERLNVRISTLNPAKSVGLTQDDAKHRLETNGKNILSPPKRKPEILKFLEGFLNFFMLLLIAAGILSIITYALATAVIVNLYLGLVLFVIVIITVMIDYFQNRKAEQITKVFKTMLPLNSRVIREGLESVIKAEDLVTGDVVHLTTGDKVPADLRIFFTNNCKVERSSMTGESEPELLTVNPTDDNVLGSQNVALSGSLVVDGESYGIVFKTGDHTALGQIAKLASSKRQTVKKGKLCGLLGSPGDTTLEVEVKRFVFIIGCLSIGMAIIFFVIGIAQGQDPLFTFINGFITVIVANVPQGLPATVTSCLAIAAQRLAKKNVLVKRLTTMETLGAANVICSDKTGTLTQNKMTVTNLWFDYTSIPASDTYQSDSGATQNKSYLSLFRVAVLCNRAYFDSTNDEQTAIRKSLEKSGYDVRPSFEEKRNRPSLELRELGSGDTMPAASNKNSLDFNTETSLTLEEIETHLIIGDASESALLRYCSILTNTASIKQRFPKLFEIPFNSKNKWQLSIHQCDKKHLLVIKGAPEVILAKCSAALVNGEKVAVDDDFMAKYTTAYKAMAGNGERVLGFAHKKFVPEEGVQYLPGEESFPNQNFTFLGLISLQDPPRIGVKEAIDTCHTAGVRIVMVTGDHPYTAEAIAKQVGIIKHEKTRADIAKERGVDEAAVSLDDVGAIVVTGSEVNSFADEDWARAFSKAEIVFARTSPQNKLEIVKRFQMAGNVVAVTGDGVNDSPALKQADLGVAMGISGSDVAREAAEIILLDDNFPNIILGITEGRVIYDNLKKTIAYTLTHLWPEIVPVLCYLAFGLPLGLSAILVLMIDAGTELAPAISFAHEPPENDVMKRPPRNIKKDHLVAFPILSYAYLQIGMIETGLCFLSYFMVFYSYGIPASSLPFTFAYFTSTSPDFVVGDLTFTAAQQVQIISEVNAAWFLCIVMCQVFHVWMCKTRVISLFKHNVIKNWRMLLGIGVSLVILILIVYVPYIQIPFSTVAVPGWFWLPPVGMLIIVWPWCELRKFITRRHPKGRFAKGFAW